MNHVSKHEAPSMIEMMRIKHLEISKGEFSMKEKKNHKLVNIVQIQAFSMT